MENDALKKVLVINGSPHRKKSNTMTITDAFLSGLNEKSEYEINIVQACDLKVKPCMGCLSCWGRTAGECVIKEDDIPSLKEEILSADIILTSYPLYYFSMPGVMKVILDRLLCMMSTYEGQKAPKNGQSFHGLRFPCLKDKKFILVSTCAYTDASEVYKPLLAQHDCILGKGNYTPILVPQMKTLNDLHNENKIKRYLEKFIQAGRDFAKNGFLSPEEIESLSKPPFSEGAYKIFLKNFWDEEKKKGKKNSEVTLCLKK